MPDAGGVHPENLSLCSLHLADDFPVFLGPLTDLRITCERDRLPTPFGFPPSHEGFTTTC